MKKWSNIVRRRETLYGLTAVCAGALLAMPLIPTSHIPRVDSAPSAQGIRDREPDSPTDAIAGDGRRERFVRVDRWGRYSIGVKSQEGTALEVVDRLRGTFARAGEAGRVDGQVDVFLETGDYKIVTESPRGARGDVNVTVARFVPAGAAADNLPVVSSPDSLAGKKGAGGKRDENDYAYLKPFEQTAAELGAMEARGWWIFVPRDTVVYIEAMGRHLGGLAVFRKGDWLVAEAEDSFINGSVPEKPLNGLRVIRRLERGKHLVVAYGGGKDRYAVSDGASPLYVQWMLDRIAPAQQVSAKIGGSGAIRYVLPPQSATYIIESVDKEKLTVEAYSLNVPKMQSGTDGSASGRSVASADIFGRGAFAYDVDATLSSEGGLKGYGSGYGSGYTSDLRVGGAAISRRTSAGYDRMSLLGTASTHPDPPGSSRNGNGRANPSVTVNVREASVNAQQILSISGKPGSAFRITPTGETGLQYRYTPTVSGAHRLATFHTGFAADNIGASGVLVDERESEIIALQADTVHSARRLYRKFNLLGEITSFVWVDEAGTYTFRPSGEAEFDWRVRQFFVREPSGYSAPRKTRGESEIALKKGLYIIELYPVKMGRAAFALAGRTADREVSAGVRADADEPRPSVSLRLPKLMTDRAYRFYLNSQKPEMSSIIIEKAAAPAPEKFAVITGEAAEREEAKTAQVSELELGVPQYASVGKNGFMTYRFALDKAGIYRIETLGRLHTKLTARDRFDGFRYMESGNGAGRNALIAGYFLAGSYLLVAECEGESAGRMGVVVNRGGMRADGRLQEGIDRRADVAAYSAAYYDFTAAERGRYRVESFGVAGPMPVRFEDHSGWPLFEHGLEGPREVELGRGAYKLFTLPIPYENYRVTRIERIAGKQRQISGYGPHAIRVNEPVSARWAVASAAPDSAAKTKRAGRAASDEEPAARVQPARFLFEVPARMEAKISLSPDFQGLLKPQGRDTALATIAGIRRGVVLDKGRYEIAVTPVRETNHAPYELSIATTDLLAGVGYNIDSAGMMRVRVGEGGVYEIFSQGGAEVSARLYAEDKKTEIARSGSDHQDWNFVISERLDSGTYYLNPTISGASGKASTKIHMRRVEDTLMQTISLSGSGAVNRKISLAGKQAVIPIECSSDDISFGDIMVLGVSGSSNIVCALEAREARPAASGKPKRPTAVTGLRRGKRIDISTPVEKESLYTLKIWSEDNISDEVRIQMKTVEAIPLTYEKALSGVTGTAAKERDNTVFYRIDDVAGGPGHYELIATQNEISGVSGVSRAEKVFQREPGSMIESAGKQLWIEASFEESDKYRFVLSPVLITDIREVSDRNRRKFETADKYRFSKNKVTYPERDELPVVVRPGQEKIFEIDSPMSKFGLITFTMNAGQPLAGLSAPPRNADFVRNGMPVLGGQYIDERVCVTAVIPGDTGRIIGWNALPGGPPEGISGGFTMRHFILEKADTLKTGRTLWQTKASLAKEYVMEPNRSRVVNIKLSPHTGFLYAPPDGRRGMYYGGEGGAQYTLEPDGGRLFLFGRAEGGSIELETFAGDAGGGQKSAVTELGAGAEIVRRFSVDTKETIRVKGDARSSGRLFWSGAVRNVDWIDRSGRMTPGAGGESAPAGDGGTVLVKYAPGWSKLKLCRDDGGQSALYGCLWGEPVKTDNVPVVKEMSRLTMVGGVNWYAIDVAGPAHVSLSAPTPAAAVVVSGGKIVDYGEFWDDFAWDLPLAPGKYAIGVKPLAGRTLAGTPLTVGFYPVSLLAEGRPLNMYMMPGQRRIVRFDLDRRGRVGTGLTMAGETVEAVLLDSRGKRLGEGRQIFAELDSGTYHLLLSMPVTQSSASPVLNGTDVKLYLFGQNNPPADPPDELVKWIIGGGVGDRP